MVSIFLMISSSLSLFSRLLETVPRVPTMTGITVIFMSHDIFSSLLRSSYLHIFFAFFYFTLWFARTEKSKRYQVVFFLIKTVWSSSLELKFHLYVKVPENFMRLIFKERFWLVYLPFVNNINFCFKIISTYDITSYCNECINRNLASLFGYPFRNHVQVNFLSL